MRWNAAAIVLVVHVIRVEESHDEVLRVTVESEMPFPVLHRV